MPLGEYLPSGWSRVTVSPPGSGQMVQMVVVPVLRWSRRRSSVRGMWWPASASR